MTRTIPVGSFWGLVLLTFAGCGQSKDAPPVSKVSPEPAAVEKLDLPDLPPTATVDIGLELVFSTELEKIIQSHKGKVVVADFWATSCVPCRREFPNLVKLHAKLGPAGVVCMSVSVDEETDQAAALAFLRKQQARFPNYLLNEDQGIWQKTWNVEHGIPVVFVYDRAGKLAKQFGKKEGETFTYADVTKLVEDLLGK